MKRLAALAAVLAVPLAACDLAPSAAVPPGCHLDKAGSVVCPPPPPIPVDIAQRCYVLGFDVKQCKTYARANGWPG